MHVIVGKSSSKRATTIGVGMRSRLQVFLVVFRTIAPISSYESCRKFGSFFSSPTTGSSGTVAFSSRVISEENETNINTQVYTLLVFYNKRCLCD